MQCPNCKLSYNKETRSPLLLITCGHSLCSTCASSLFSQQEIVCPECKKTCVVESVGKLPKNIALLMVTGSPEVLQMCAIHGKKIEGFCEDDKKLLCINCILIDGHKTHEVSPIRQAVLKAKQELVKDMELAIQLKGKLNNFVNDIENIKHHLVDKTNKKQEEVDLLYKEIIDVITAYKDTLKEIINGIMVKEEVSLDEQAQNYKYQLKLIEEFKELIQTLQNKSDYEILNGLASKRQTAIQATKTLKEIMYMPRFPEIVKESELNTLWKLLSTPCKKLSIPQKKMSSPIYKTYSTQVPQTPKSNTIKKETRHLSNTASKPDRQSPFSTPNPSSRKQELLDQIITLDLSKAIGRTKEDFILRSTKSYNVSNALKSRRERHKLKQINSPIKAIAPQYSTTKSTKKGSIHKEAKANPTIFESAIKPTQSAKKLTSQQSSKGKSDTMQTDNECVDENERLSLSLMLEKLNEYIYVFCNFKAD